MLTDLKTSKSSKPECVVFGNQESAVLFVILNDQSGILQFPIQAPSATNIICKDGSSNSVGQGNMIKQLEGQNISGRLVNGERPS